MDENSNSANVDHKQKSHPFALLDPSFILAAIESVGYQVDGRVTALNRLTQMMIQVSLQVGEMENQTIVVWVCTITIIMMIIWK